MNEEIIRQLSVITDEEQKILSGQKDINKTIYTEKKEMVIDCDKLLQKGKLIQVRPHTRFVHFPKHRHNYIEVIYMCKGSRNVRIHLKNHLPVKVMFQDYKINGLESNRVYELVLEIPDAPSPTILIIISLS